MRKRLRRGALAEDPLHPSRRALIQLPALMLAPPGSSRRRPGEVMTVRGRVRGDQLGTALMHEHLVPRGIPEGKVDESLAVADQQLADASRVGIQTVVDLTPTRDAVHYKKIAGRSPVHIVVCTGSYLQSQMPERIQAMGQDELHGWMLREIEQGIDGTDVRPGIIKVAADKAPLTAWEKGLFRAAARAQRTTGIPIATHAIFAPREQFDLLVASGADPTKLFFSHIEAKFGWQGRTREQMADSLASIARDGGSLLFNNFGYEFHTPWPDLVYLIRSLCDRGHARRVLISADYYTRWKDGRLIRLVEDRYPESARKTLAYMITEAVPALLKAGFSAAEVRTFMVDNPRRFLCG